MKDFPARLSGLKGNGPVVGCFPLYPPLELMHSMGVLPVVLWDLRDQIKERSLSDTHLQNFVCSVARNLTEFIIGEGGPSFDGLFMYNACDTLRNLPEIIEEGLAVSGKNISMLKMHIPAARPDAPYSKEYMKRETEELLYELQNITGESYHPDRFRRSVQLYRVSRELLGDLEYAVIRGHMSFAEYSELAMLQAMFPPDVSIGPLLGNLERHSPSCEEDPGAPRVIISGILPPPASVIKDIEDAGLIVAGNDIAAFHRASARMPDDWPQAHDFVIDFYAEHFPCPTLLYTADNRLEALINLAEKRQADGFIFAGEKFCEYEYFEFPWITQKLEERGLKTLVLEFAIDDRETGTWKTRIEAFAELLRQDP